MKKKIIVGTMILVIFLMWLFGFPRHKEIYLFQNNFQEEVLILYDRKNFKEVPQKFLSSFYVMPRSGIISTGTIHEYAWNEPECYYMDTIENADKYVLNNTWKSHIIRKLIYNDFSGMIAGIYGNTSDPNSIKFIQFGIQNEYSAENIYTTEYKANFNKTAQLITGDSSYKPIHK